MEAVMIGCDTVFDKYTNYFTVSPKFNSWSDIQEIVQKAGVDGFKKVSEVSGLLDICISNIKNNQENPADIKNVVQSVKEMDKAINNFKSLLGHYKMDVPEVKLFDESLEQLGKKIGGFLAMKLMIVTLLKSQADYEAGKNFITAEEFLSVS